ncbi:cupin domain-containing protein [Halorarum halobium]|uniref:cupin domain-containing protein n=1 Tax=Halorarum halobium TaxID=3075121 RepID=UPI0028AEC54A|nr:cupin domain-containing protein [Halobaculum sp. XH14]
MERVAVDDVENRVQPAAVLKPLTDALGCTDLALNYYELAPGDSFAFAYHSHDAQEEVFVVIEGEATFETSARPGGTEDAPGEPGSGDVREVSVGPNEAIHFAPGEFQRGWNRGDERVRAFALGAPLVYEGGETLVECPECGDRTEHDIVDADDEPAARAVVCTECGTETQRWRRGPDGENEWV